MGRRDGKGSTTRMALGLYGSLLVLPTLVFGWLYYRELEKDFERQREEIPDRAKKGARRIIDGMKVSLERMLETEERRPFYQYSKLFLPDDELDDSLLLPQTSPMVRGERPEGLQAWFSYPLSRNAEIEVFVGDATERRFGTIERLKPILEDLRRRQRREVKELTMSSFEETDSDPVPLASVMVKMGHENDRDCLVACSQLVRGERIHAAVSQFRLLFYIDQEGTPRAIATRKVTAAPFYDALPSEAPCLMPLTKGFSLYQGFIIDTNWLLKDLPWEIEKRLLDKDMVLRVPNRGYPMEITSQVFEPITPVRELNFETPEPDDASAFGLEVVINDERIEERIRRQSTRFFTVALMLVVTLGIGMTLLYRSVRAELEQARRMQNFVAAVTHELRTPVSTIRLHAEMLLEGWASDPLKQKEYYKRIVRETDRLSVLVERVLEKSRIKENRRSVEPGDLNEIVSTLASDLAHAPYEGEPVDDLRVELAPDLPPVWMTLEAVTGILTNLVENARKYAPAKDEPILVRTLLEGDRVLLQVHDRGPGVPAEEREKIFEAFYRVGSEATRTTTGTGLGLHLVRIHAEACRARESVLDREGGGSIFQVAFEIAPPVEEPRAPLPGSSPVEA